MHRHAVLDQGVDELRCCEKVALVRRNDVTARIAQCGIPKIVESVCPLDVARRRCPCVAAAALDRVETHFVDVEE